MVLELIKAKFPIPQIAIAQGLSNAKICGRFQVIPGTVTRIFDVAHNPLGAQVLAELLQQHPGQGETHAVIGMLKDKDIASFCKIMLHCIQHWHIAPLNSPRTATSQHFAEQLTALGINPIHQYPSITAAYKHLLAHVESGSRIIVCGSFYSVAEALTVELG
jgi:dihydrofolate synthase/folylpolyglutamate synthase